MTSWRLAVATGGLLGALASHAYASGLVVADSRVQELPSIRVGAGYALVTNQMFGECLGTAASGPSTYEMDYGFVEIDPERLATLDNDAREFVIAHREVPAGEGKVAHHLLARLTVREVSAPLAGEGKGLTDEARNTIRRGDLTGFLAACGTHYVRAVRRRSQFMALFSYTTVAGEKRDSDFERDLLLSVTAFDPDTSQSASEKSRDANVAAAGVARGLRVTVRASGLGAQAAPQLPFDLAGYRKALQEAYKASQLDGVGEPVSIEIVPWLDLPAVLDSLESIGHGTTTDQRRTLREAADFFLELLLANQQAHALVMKARTCRRRFDAAYREEDGTLHAGLDGAEMVRDNGERQPLADLLTVLTDQGLDALLEAERTYSRTAIEPCMNQLEQTGLKTRPAELAECKLPEPFRSPSAFLVHNYCPVRIYVPDR